MTTITDIQSSTSASEHLVCFAFFITTLNAGLLFMARSLANMYDLQCGDHEDPNTITIFTDALDIETTGYQNLEACRTMLAQFPDGDQTHGIRLSRDVATAKDYAAPRIMLEKNLESCRGLEQLEDLLLQLVGVPDGSIRYDHPHFADHVALANTPGFQGFHMKEAVARRKQPALNL
jgi:hypothetical protein